MKYFLIIISIFLLTLSFFSPKKNDTSSQKFFLKRSQFCIPEIGFEKAILTNIETVNHLQFKGHEADSLDPFLLETRNGIEFSSSSIELYYYALLDTTDYYSVIYFSFNEANEQCYDLVNYTKNYKIIDFYRGLSCFAGDEDFFYETIGEFLNDSIIIQRENEGIFTSNTQVKSISKKEYTLQKNNIIEIDKTGNIMMID